MRWGGWRVGQRRGVGRHPVGHRLVDHAQMARDAPQAHPVDVEADGLPTDDLIIATPLGVRRVLALAVRAQVALAPRRGQADTLLLVGVLAVRAMNLFHILILPTTQPFSHSPCRDALDNG